MRVAELIADCPGIGPLPEKGSVGGVEISSIAEDSRQVRPGALFIARPGTKTDGRAFLADAVARGAVAVLSDPTLAIPGAKAQPLVIPAVDVPLAAAHLAERFHGNPSRALHLVGITGTNGKTTTAFLVQQLLGAAGTRCGLIGTVLVDDGATRTPAELTTPSAIDLSVTLARMVANGCAAAAMECSSHALHQRRTAGLRFAVGMFTNLTGDHLDYHGSMEAYADAKAILFDGLDDSATAVVNVDDPASARMVRTCRARVLRCSVRDSRAEFFGHVDEIDPTGVALRLSAPWGMSRLHLPLTGVHNAMNALEAAAAAHALGVAGDTIVAALSRAKAPPGRLEPVTAVDDPFSILVDYAHTDDALDNVLRALRAVVPPSGRLRVVFGCGGDRDRTKRPRMAAVAARLADEIVVTSDNPRTEDPEAIVDEIMTGFDGDATAGHRRPNVERVSRIVDRADAIEHVVGSARPGDVILIAGKGHEDYQIVGTVKRPFDDRIVAREALGRRTAASCVARDAVR